MAVKKQYESLHDLLILKLDSLFDIEQQIIKALPKMVKAAEDEQLREAFAAHLEETRHQGERVEEALQLLEVPLGKSKVEGIRGIIEDAEWCIKNVKDPAARDAILIAAAQYVEHYEMAGYGAARTWAEVMGHNEVADLLQTTLDEESAANDKLTKLAESGINEKANDMKE